MVSSRLPRDLTADELIQALRRLAYEPVRQTGSHIRIRTELNGEHHETIPYHSPLKVGTLRAILSSIAQHHQLSRPELLRLLGL